MDDKETGRRQRRDFFKGFFLTLAFIVPVYTCAVLFSSLGGIILPETEQVSEVSDKVPIASSVKSYNLLFGVYDSNQESKLLALTLLRFDTTGYRIIVCDLPTVAVALEAKAPRTIASIFASRGMLGAVEAVKETLLIPISGYIAIGTDELTRMVDELGTLDYNLAQDISVYDESGIMVYSKHAGASSYSGNDVAKLLVFGPEPGEERTRMNEALWESALVKYASTGFDGHVLDIYNLLVDRMSTNISAADIYSLARAVKAVCGTGHAQYELFRLDGGYLDSRFELAENSDERFWVYFPKAA